MPARQTAIAARRAVALELYLPMGARILYGFLGAEYEPRPSAALEVQTTVCNSPAAPVAWSLAARVDDVRAGLPASYAPAVMACAEHAAEALGSGTIQFEPAAHAIAGSAFVVFRSLAMALVDLLSRAPDELTVEATRGLIDHQLLENHVVYA